MGENCSEQPPWFEVAARAYRIQKDAQASSGRVQSLRRFILLPGLFLNVDYRAEWQRGQRWHEEVKKLTDLTREGRERTRGGEGPSYQDLLIEWLKNLGAFCDALQQYAYSQFSFWATGEGERDPMVNDVKRLGRAESQARTAANKFLALAMKRDWGLYRSLKRGEWCR